MQKGPASRVEGKQNSCTVAISSSIDYSIDGGTEQNAFLNEPLHVEGRQYVDVSIRYWNVFRVRAIVGRRPYKLSCEYQGQERLSDTQGRNRG